MFGTILKSALAVGVTAVAATIGIAGTHDAYTTIRRKLSNSTREASPRKRAKAKPAARRRPAKKAAKPAARRPAKKAAERSPAVRRRTAAKKAA